MTTAINPAIEWTANTEEHPARLAAWRALDALLRKNKEDYLALYAPEGAIYSPVGPSEMDPEGVGHRGRDGLSKFWDTTIAPIEGFRFAIHSSYAAGNEVANAGRITVQLPGDLITDIDCIVVYQVNAEGRLLAIREYWEPAQVNSSVRKR